MSLSIGPTRQRLADRSSSFLFSVEAQVYRTGPVYATISAMELDLAGPKGIYGKLMLPEMKITPTETKINVKDQRIQITNMEAFFALQRELVQGEMTTLSLENGSGTVKVMRMIFPIKFSKKCEIKGMNGPKTEFAGFDGEKVLAKIYNPSPLEMDLGNAVFECRNAQGRALAQQRGRINIRRGESQHEVSMDIVAGEDMEDAGDVSKLWMVGIDVDGGDAKSWMKEGIKHYNVQLGLTADLMNLISSEEKKLQEARRAQGVSQAVQA